MAGDGEQVGRHHRSHYVAAEGSKTPPGTAIHTEGPLQERDHPLDPGPEVPEPLVNPGTLYHLGDLKSPSPPPCGCGLSFEAVRQQPPVQTFPGSLGDLSLGL